MLEDLHGYGEPGTLHAATSGLNHLNAHEDILQSRERIEEGITQHLLDLEAVNFGQI